MEREERPAFDVMMQTSLREVSSKKSKYLNRFLFNLFKVGLILPPLVSESILHKADNISQSIVTCIDRHVYLCSINGLISPEVIPVA